jgi:hypothetical protein
MRLHQVLMKLRSTMKDMGGVNLKSRDRRDRVVVRSDSNKSNSLERSRSGLKRLGLLVAQSQ